MKIEIYLNDEEQKALDWYAEWNNRLTEKMRGETEGHYLKMTAEDLLPIAIRHYIKHEIMPEMEKEQRAL